MVVTEANHARKKTSPAWLSEEAHSRGNAGWFYSQVFNPWNPVTLPHRCLMLCVLALEAPSGAHFCDTGRLLCLISSLLTAASEYSKGLDIFLGLKVLSHEVTTCNKFSHLHMVWFFSFQTDYYNHSTLDLRSQYLSLPYRSQVLTAMTGCWGRYLRWQ